MRDDVEPHENFMRGWEDYKVSESFVFMFPNLTIVLRLVLGTLTVSSGLGTY